jgi:hypothetical protein
VAGVTEFDTMASLIEDAKRMQLPRPRQEPATETVIDLTAYEKTLVIPVELKELGEPCGF